MSSKELPKTCSKCEFYYETPYTCHNERGMESKCQKGYMSGDDMRDQNYRLQTKRYEGCKLNK